jgi:hypothetical protein
MPAAVLLVQLCGMVGYKKSRLPKGNLLFLYCDRLNIIQNQAV